MAGGKSTKVGAGAVIGTSGLATAIVWLLGHFHVSLSAEDGSIIAGLISATTLFVWHTGIRNIGRHVLGGDETPAVAEPGT